MSPDVASTQLSNVFVLLNKRRLKLSAMQIDIIINLYITPYCYLDSIISRQTDQHNCQKLHFLEDVIFSKNAANSCLLKHPILTLNGCAMS